MQDLYFFFEQSECKTRTPYKIGNSYLNYFAINEDAVFEIESVNFLRESNAKMAEVWNEPDYKTHKLDRRSKEDFDSQLLSSCILEKSNSESKTKERETHIIYVGHYYNFWEGLTDKF